MDKSDAIVLGLLAFIWMGMVATLAVCMALTYQEGSPGFVSLAITLWPFSLALGCFGLFTVAFLFKVIPGWEPDKRLGVILEKTGSVFLILLVIATYVFLNDLFKLDPSIGPQFWPAMFVLLIPGFIICYPLVYSLVKPLTREQVSDPRWEELDLNLPFNEAFTRCQDAIEMIDATEYTCKKTFDPVSGTLSIDAFPQYYVGYPKRPTRIIISLNKTDATIVTHVKISAVTLPGLYRIPSGLNEGYVNRIAGFLRGKKPGREDDNSPPEVNA